MPRNRATFKSAKIAARATAAFVGKEISVSQRIFLGSVAAVGFAALIALPAAAQTSAPPQPPAVASDAPVPNYAVPKTPWGAPDLQGTWTSDDTWGVPFQRPAKYGTRAFLTEDELQAREKNVKRSEQFVETGGGDTHSPAVADLKAKEEGKPLPQPKGRFGSGVDAAPVPGFWGEFARRASRQTSQVVFPDNGQIPALTAEAQAALAAKMKLRRDPIPASYTNWSYYDRCITRGVAGSILPVIYGNGLQIVQSPGYVAIRYEMVHDIRIIPTDDRAHISSNIRSYMGDAVGHWEGNTLVVETTNLLGGRMAVGVNGDGGPPYSEDMKLIERFTRVAPNRINYELTVDDPKTYTGVWKVAFPITHEPGYELFEYACHEGNMAMHNMLSAARAEDAKKAAAEAK
jgi:hypothetical protein